MPTDLRLRCVEGEGLGGDSPPQQSEGLHVAYPLRYLGNGDVGVGAKHFPV